MKQNLVGGSPPMANASIHSLRKIRDTKYFADQRGYETDYLKRKTTKDRELKSKVSRLDEDVKAYLKQTGAVGAAAVTLTDADASNLDYASEVESKIKRLQAKHLANSPVFEKLLASSHKDLMRIHSGTASAKSTNNEFSSVEALNLQQSHQPQQPGQTRYSSSALTIAGTPYKSPQFQSKQNVSGRCLHVEGRWDQSNSMQEDTVIARILESSFENTNIDSNAAEQRQQRRRKQDDKPHLQDLNQDSIEDLMDVDESECESRKAVKSQPQTNYLGSASSSKHQYLSPRRQIYLSPQHQNNNNSPSIKTTTANSNSAKSSHHQHHHQHHNSGSSNPAVISPQLKSSTPTSHFINTNSPNAHYLKPNLAAPGNVASNYGSNQANSINGTTNVINRTATQTPNQQRNALNAGSFNSFAVNSFNNNNLISMANMSNASSSSSLVQNGSNVRNKISSLLIQNNNNNSNQIQSSTTSHQHHHNRQNNRIPNPSSLQQQLQQHARVMPQDLLTGNNQNQFDSKQLNNNNNNADENSSLAAGYSASYNYKNNSHNTRKDSQFSFQNTSPLVQQQQQQQPEILTSLSPPSLQSQPGSSSSKSIVEQYFLSEIEKQNDLVQQQQRQIVLYQQQLQQQTIEFQLFLQEQQLLQARQQLLQQQQQQQQKQLLISSQVGLNNQNGLLSQFQANQQLQQPQQQPTPIVINNNISKDHFLPPQQQQQQYQQQLQQVQQLNQQQQQQLLAPQQYQQQFSFMQGNQSNRADLTSMLQEGSQQQQQLESNEKYKQSSSQYQASRSGSQHNKELQHLNDQSNRSNRLEEFQSAEKSLANNTNNQQSFASSFAYNPNRAGSSQRRKWDVSQRAGTASESMDDDALSCRSKEGKMTNMMTVLPPSLLQNPVKKPVKFEIFWEKDEIDHEMKEKEEKERKEREEAERHVHAVAGMQSTQAAAANGKLQDIFSAKKNDLHRRLDNEKLSHQQVTSSRNAQDLSKEDLLEIRRQFLKPKAHAGNNHNNNNGTSIQQSNEIIGSKGASNASPNKGNYNNNNNKNNSDNSQATTNNNIITINADSKNNSNFNNNTAIAALNATAVTTAPAASLNNYTQNLGWTQQQQQQPQVSNQSVNNVNFGNNVSGQLNINNSNQQDQRTNQQQQQTASEIIYNQASLRLNNNQYFHNSNSMNAPSTVGFSSGSAFSNNFNNINIISQPSLPPASTSKDVAPPLQIQQYPPLSMLPAVSQPNSFQLQQQPQIYQQPPSAFLQNPGSYTPVSQQPVFQPYVNPLQNPSYSSISHP